MALTDMKLKRKKPKQYIIHLDESNYVSKDTNGSLKSTDQLAEAYTFKSLSRALNFCTQAPIWNPNIVLYPEPFIGEYNLEFECAILLDGIIYKENQRR